MSAQEELFHAYQAWREISTGERAAIQASDWLALDRWQGEKAVLAVEISALGTQAEAEAESVQPDGRGRFQDRLRRTVRELIEVETRTGEMLAQARLRAKTELEALDRANANLRRMKQSYGAARAPVWTSYS